MVLVPVDFFLLETLG